jgi:hypothetical protein
MPTARSSTELVARSVVRPVADVGHLLAFRARCVRRPWAAVAGFGVVLVLTLAALLLPAYTLRSGAVLGDAVAVDAVRAWLPAMLAGFWVLAVGAAVATGGGRELLPRDQAAIHPVSPTTDHLGALLLAPLNIGWLLQAWLLLAATAVVVGADGSAGLGGLVAAQVVTGLWILAATALAQAVGWAVEAVRRRRHGIAAVRAGIALVGGAALLAQATGGASGLADPAAVRPLAGGVVAARDGDWSTWAVVVGVLAALAAAAVVAGAWPAHVAAGRAPRDELRLESGSRPARRLPASDLGMLLRIDRASVWRTVPMRRGLLVLALGPGLVALAGALPWSTVGVLPGLVVSGAALLFGVNAWCLDGRGVLWRESLPVDARLVFTSRVVVLAEWLLGASAVTLVLASLRAGVPTYAELAAVVCTWGVVTWQVVAVSMSWSGRRPFAVDLRSARATPAPPLVMVGYSSRLALTTTLTAMLFSGLGSLPAWWVSPLVAVPFVAWSTVRLLRARRRWLAPARRAEVVVAVGA